MVSMPAQATLDAPARRRREQVARIASTATDLFQRHGYETTSVNDIAGALGMSVGGLYRYISTKSDLLVLVCEDIYGELPVALARIESGGGAAAERLDALCRSYFETCAGNRRLILLMYREYRHLPEDAQARFQARETEIRQLFAKVMAEAVAAGEVRDVDPDLLAWDIVLLGHLPALKGWAVRAMDGGDPAGAQRRLLDSLLRP